MTTDAPVQVQQGALVAPEDQPVMHTPVRAEVPRAWSELPQEQHYQVWADALRQHGMISRSSSWWIGDLILYGEATFGEMYSQAVEDTGLARQTLINYVHVCRSVPHERRRAELPFGHHEAVTMLPPHEQEAWLQAAHDNQWSRQELREAIMGQRTGPPPSAPQPTPGHQQAVAVVDAAAAAAGTRPAAAPASAAPTGAQVLAAATTTLADAARDLYGAAVELEAAFADQPNQEYMAVPVQYLQRLAEILGL